MIMLLILSKYSYMELDPIEEFGAVNTLPSETQPDEVLSIQEMLENHARGIPQHVNAHYYDDDDYYPDLPDLHTLDLVEIKDLADHYKKESKRIQAEINERKEKQKQETVTKVKDQGTNDSSTAEEVIPE